MKTIPIYTGVSAAFQKRSPFTLHNRKSMSRDHSCRYNHRFVKADPLLFRWWTRLRAWSGRMGNLPIHVTVRKFTVSSLSRVTVVYTCVGAREWAFPLALSALSAFQLISIIPSPSHSCNSFAIIYILTPDLLSLSDRWLMSVSEILCCSLVFQLRVPASCSCSCSCLFIVHHHRSRNHLAHFFNRTIHHVICTDHLVPVLPVSVCVCWTDSSVCSGIFICTSITLNLSFLHLASIILCHDRTI